jgi:hypothetical protein
VKTLHNVEKCLFLGYFFVPTYEGKFQKKGWESFFEISKWTKINVQNQFSKILYGKM